MEFDETRVDFYLSFKDWKGRRRYRYLFYDFGKEIIVAYQGVKMKVKVEAFECM